MGKNILFSGLSYNQDNTDLMIQQLNDNGIFNIIDFGSYMPYKKMNNERIIERLSNHFSELAANDNVNLICHSMGCNIGLILAKEKASQIKKAVFLSPELQPTTKQEKKLAELRINNGITVSYDFSKEQPANIGIFDKIRLFKIFNQTKRLALESLDDIHHLNSLVVYGVADQFVSQKGAEELAQKLECDCIPAKTQHHNILLSGVGEETAKKMSKFLRK